MEGGPAGFWIAEEEALVGWGEKIGARVPTPLWVSLRGPLGAGKSVLARAICRGAGVTGPIPSPTFTLVRTYESPRGFEIHHVDLFRLEPGDPLSPLGWDDLMGSTGLVLVEWADRAGEQQPESRWEVRLGYDADRARRRVTARSLGAAPSVIPW